MRQEKQDHFRAQQKIKVRVVVGMVIMYIFLIQITLGLHVVVVMILIIARESLALVLGQEAQVLDIQHVLY